MFSVVLSFYDLVFTLQVMSLEFMCNFSLVCVLKWIPRKLMGKVSLKRGLVAVFK